MNGLFVKIIPEENCFRFYQLSVEPDLFEESALVVSWGRIGTLGRTIVRSSGRPEDVESLARKLAKRRLSHGYRAVDAPSGLPGAI